MAKYVITGPDGSKYEVNAPDDATEQQVMEYVQKNAQAPERPGALERGVKGFVQGLQDVPDALKQIQSRMGAAMGVPGAADAVKFWDADIKAKNDAYKQNVRGGQDDFDFGRLGGNMAFTAPLQAAVPAGGTMLRAAGNTALTSGIVGGLQPVTQGDFLAEKAKQVGAGAAAGAIAGPVANLAGRMISPNVDPAIAALRKEGVTPTPGQIMGGGFKTAEEKLASVPLLGNAIKVGQQRANEQFNVAAVNRSLEPLGQKLPKGLTGNEAIQFAEETLSKSYDDVLGRIGSVQSDQPLMQALRAAHSKLPKDQQATFAQIVQAEVGDRMRAGVMPATEFKAAESELGRVAADLRSSRVWNERKAGDAIKEAQTALRDWLKRGAGDNADDLAKVNAGYAAFKRSQRAAASVGAEDGVFNPAQLHNAVKALDKSKDKAAFARGDALMQDLSSAGKSALTNKVPNSGTTDRALAALMAGGSLTGAGLLNPALAAGAIPALAYTPMGQQAMAGLLAGRQGPVAGLLSSSVQRGALPAGMALTPSLYGLISQ